MNKQLTYQSYHPLSINQILKGVKTNQTNQIDNLVLDGSPINYVVIVGLLMAEGFLNEDEQFEAVINDTTGQLTIIAYLQEQPIPYWLEKIKMINPQSPVYVRAIIQPKQFLQKIVFKCQHMEIINDSNQILTHTLDCILAYKYRKMVPTQTQFELKLSNNNVISEDKQHINNNNIEQYKQQIITFFEQCPQIIFSHNEIELKTQIPEPYLTQSLNILVSEQIIIREKNNSYSVF